MVVVVCRLARPMCDTYLLLRVCRADGPALQELTVQAHPLRFGREGEPPPPLRAIHRSENGWGSNAPRRVENLVWRYRMFCVVCCRRIRYDTAVGLWSYDDGHA